MILITGATGNIGGATLAALVSGGRQVRALSRSDRSWPGATRAVLLSSSSAPSGDLTNAVARHHIESEQTVQASGLDWTMLQPNSFMSNALQWVPQVASGDVVRGPFGSVPIATIDPADVGAVAALALTKPGHAGMTYRLSGPEALRPEQQVEILARVLGRDLRWDGWSDAQARSELEAQMPKPYVDAFFSFFVDVLIDESTVLPTAPELLGRPPRPRPRWRSSTRSRVLGASRSRTTRRSSCSPSTERPARAFGAPSSVGAGGHPL